MLGDITLVQLAQPSLLVGGGNLAGSFRTAGLAKQGTFDLLLLLTSGRLELESQSLDLDLLPFVPMFDLFFPHLASLLGNLVCCRLTSLNACLTSS